ncbi:MAG: sulfurtransferase [Bacilli bacterium]|nr:sulfurtransferase [Bacilli bacterium]
MIEFISPVELKEKLKQEVKLTIIDVREAEEVAEGIIPGAIHIPLAEIPQRMSEIPQTDEIILVCRSGKRSQKAYEFLQSQGVPGLKNMSGGMLEWIQTD